MATWATAEGYSFNISWDATFTAMHNLGSGTFNFGAGNTSQWSLSACRTAGTLTIDGRDYTIDPDNSLTWYDRQWGYGGPTNFTWFGLRFPESNISLSVWAIDYKTEATADEWRFATARTAHGDLIVPFTFKPGAGVWTSETTNFTYPSTWELEFRDGEKLVITAVRPDQELGTAFSGFVNVEGTFLGSRGESGVVDVIFT
ncbi:Hydroxyneurosporene synthase [Macrophomina phaseolina MS6]|uniref:Hydroxyneurosporene synthase n=2 Tax=Macrophomina phaseolina TaxID=35725 RepID=K2RP82_MACPH|nr:Hydroxyneurosporene synthase [Macrophomina phaseolina MS6]